MKKGIGEKVLGWFVVTEDDETAKGEEVERGPVDAQPKPRALTPSKSALTPAKGEPARPIVTPGRAHDATAFAAVYQAAGLDAEDHQRLAKVLELLASLPSEATPDVKRAIVGAALSAFGVPIDRIVATADAATAALDAYVIEGRHRTDEVLAQAQARIDRLSAEIEEVRSLMATQVEAQTELIRATGIEKARVRAALDFFGPAPAHQQPRLVRLK